MAWLHDQQKREKWIQFLQTLSPDSDPKAIKLIDEVFFVNRLIHHMGEQSLKESGLSSAQYRVLMHLFYAEKIGDRSELNPSEISDRQGVSRNTMSSLISNLEKGDLIERHLDKKDRRRFNISLTEMGRSLVTNYARQHFHAVGKCFAVLNADEQETLSHLLRKVGIHAQSIS